MKILIDLKKATFLDTTGQMDKAEEYYLQSIEANIRHSNVYCVYADFLVYERGVCILFVSLLVSVSYFDVFVLFFF